MERTEWPLWEIFIRSQHGLAHKHVGSLHAPDAEMAIKNARDVYTRRNEGVSIWAVRSAQRRPVLEVCPDPLPERRRVASSANDLAADPPAFLDVRRRTSVERLEARSAGIRVRFSGGDEDDFDAVVALTGFRPDLSFVSELALEIAPATEGAARLSRALGNVTDCLSVPAVSAGDLESGEPGFYFVGAKSYGRGRTFLLRTGLAHLETILSRAVSPTGTTFA